MRYFGCDDEEWGRYIQPLLDMQRTDIVNGFNRVQLSIEHMDKAWNKIKDFMAKEG